MCVPMCTFMYHKLCVYLCVRLCTISLLMYDWYVIVPQMCECRLNVCECRLKCVNVG